MRQLEDFTGRTFNRLTVESEAPRGPKSMRMMNCVCVCGGRKVVPLTSLKLGLIKSCGCLRVEKARSMGQNVRKYTGCSYCGSEKHYAQGYCRICYNRFKRTGTVEYRRSTPEVDCYDKNGVFLKTYNTVKEAGEALNIDVNRIYKNLNGRKSHAGSYIFARKDKEPKKCVGRKNRDVKSVNLYDINTGELVKTFNSIKEAITETGGTRQGAFSAINGKLKTYFGYVWGAEYY